MNSIVQFRLCTLSDEELAGKVDQVVDQFYETGRIPSCQIPARPDDDFDLLVGELCVRLLERVAPAVSVAAFTAESNEAEGTESISTEGERLVPEQRTDDKPGLINMFSLDEYGRELTSGDQYVRVRYGRFDAFVRQDKNADIEPRLLQQLLGGKVVGEGPDQRWIALQRQGVDAEGVESDSDLEQRTEYNMNLISQFLEHLTSEAGIVVPEEHLLSFFNA